MDERELRHAASLLGLKIFGKAVDGWLSSQCPLAPWTHEKGYDRNPSFGLKIDASGRSGYHCFSCKHKGSIPGLAFKLANLSGDDDLREVGRQIEETETLGTPKLLGWDEEEEYDLDLDSLDKSKKRISYNDAVRGYKPFYLSERALKYLTNRRIPLFTAMKLRLHYDESDMRILFPVFDYWTRKFEGFTGRMAVGPKYLKLMNRNLKQERPNARPIPKVKDYYGLDKQNLLLFDPTVNFADHASVIVVEGLFAYARLQHYGFRNVVALLGSELTHGKRDILEAIDKPIYWLVDDDEAGTVCLHGRWNDDRNEYSGDGVLNQFYGKVPQFVPKYPNGVDDPDDLSYEQLTSMLSDCELYT